ncbi:MAG: hypothetical protein AB2421_10965 [Thermotaleaceae bacterium]
MHIGYIAIGILFVFLFGYNFGRKTGITEGYEKALAHAPLKFREEVYLLDKCPVCGKEN